MCEATVGKGESRRPALRNINKPGLDLASSAVSNAENLLRLRSEHMTLWIR